MSGTSPVPEWERLFPGYMEWELACLRQRARAVVVNREKLAQGQLEVTFDWPLRGKWTPLRAEFQSTHPYVRPQVFLCTAAEDWPERHVAPDSGNICLLGRDTVQWPPEWSLAELLERQLEGALLGGGEEDPQGEPAEFWWNNIGRGSLRDSYCLVDSDWDLRSADSGNLELIVSFWPPVSRDDKPQVRAYVRRVLDTDSKTIAEWTMPLPPGLAEGRVMRVPWYRLDSVLLPRPNIARRLDELRQAHFGGPGRREALPGGINIRPYVFLHPIELDENRIGDGWLLGIEWGTSKDFSGRPGTAPKGTVIPILRAGRSDMGARVPAISALAGRTVVVVGVGALGAPIAIELARNGVGRLVLVDHDVVEPGNSVRWPLGAPVWGKLKITALKEYIEAQFPGCKVEPRQHALGMNSNPTDDELLSDVLEDASLVIDASASHGVNRLLWDRTQRRSVPMIQLGATPEVRGGTVVHYPVGGPCVLCLERARDAGTVDEAAGSEDERRVQPAGCGERTFVGADYDLQELSLQAIRQAVAVVSRSLTAGVVDTLDLAFGGDRCSPPLWRRQALEPSSECNCRKIRDASAAAPVSTA
jgi:molybdopterin/thiamine biosynthesis adenylyltransferase